MRRFSFSSQAKASEQYFSEQMSEYPASEWSAVERTGSCGNAKWSGTMESEWLCSNSLRLEMTTGFTESQSAVVVQSGNAWQKQNQCD